MRTLIGRDSSHSGEHDPISFPITTLVFFSDKVKVDQAGRPTSTYPSRPTPIPNITAAALIANPYTPLPYMQTIEEDSPYFPHRAA
jgi:hypothetical protein